MTLNNWDILLLLVIPLAIVATGLFFRRRKALFFSGKGASKHPTIDHIFSFLYPLILSVFIILMAKPGYSWQEKRSQRLTLDMVVCFDVSGSMQAQDFTPTRLESAKKVVGEFLEQMKGNRMGLVLFSGLAFTQSPLTFDTEILKILLSDAESGMVRIDGTAIGNALATAINRLQKSGESNEKVIVLLTDGENNRGQNPLAVANIAKKENIRIYTVGMGTPQGYTFTYKDIFGNERPLSTTGLDEELLRQVAQTTGGIYFRGDNERGLQEAYRKIGQLEKKKVTSIDKRVFFPRYRLLGLLLFMLLILDLIFLLKKRLIRL